MDQEKCNCEQSLEAERLLLAVAKAWKAWHETDARMVSEEVVEACWECVAYFEASDGGE